MDKGMSESDVSDDDSDSPSFDKLLDLIHEQQGVMKTQSKEIKQLNALNDLNAILVTNYDDLLCKFKLLNKEHEELKLKIKSIKNAMKNAMRIVVKSCDDLIAKENDELKEEVERLKRDLARLKGKSIVQPSQYNCEDMVKKLEK
jgi:ribosomal protein L29